MNAAAYDPEPADRRTGAERPRVCRRTEREVYDQTGAYGRPCAECRYPAESHDY